MFHFMIVSLGVGFSTIFGINRTLCPVDVSRTTIHGALAPSCGFSDVSHRKENEASSYIYEHAQCGQFQTSHYKLVMYSVLL